jgi:hypothetical protein
MDVRDNTVTFSTLSTHLSGNSRTLSIFKSRLHILDLLLYLYATTDELVVASLFKMKEGIQERRFYAVKSNQIVHRS